MTSMSMLTGPLILRSPVVHCHCEFDLLESEWRAIEGGRSPLVRLPDFRTILEWTHRQKDKADTPGLGVSV
jgi:hypothetical protein